ncbi:MAG: ABC transporter substrate-binding protein, partial [Deltaproteobacteria bacterium]|nr:ABC transporter substrate-binding protein [Deltaproteobacteria bacterium]
MNRNVFLFILTVIPVFIGIWLSNTACTDAKKGECIFAYQDRVADAISIIAAEKGFFKEQGLSLVLKRFSSGPECMEALASGSADFGTMGDTTAIIVSA